MTAAVILGVFFVIEQQIENHVIQPLVDGRTVQLSPLAVLVSVLIGAGARRTAARPARSRLKIGANRADLSG